jgi:predicted nucleic acid-binding Zn ribbon protein
MAFDSIKDILAKIRARNPSLQKRLEEATAVDAWERAVGPQIARHARALKVDQGTLWVEVDHAVWKTELHHRKRQILEKLNEGAGNAQPIRDLFLIEPKRTYSTGASTPPGAGARSWPKK